MRRAVTLSLNLLVVLSFAVLAQAQGVEIVHDFIRTGYNPDAGLIQANDGFLYGTTNAGGVFDQGTVFRVEVLAR